MEEKLKKLATFEENENLAIFDELQEVNDKLVALAEAIQYSKNDVVSVSNLEEVKTDLSPLKESFEELKVSIGQVKDTINGIKVPKEINLTGIEKILTTISEKKQENIDFSELKNISDILTGVLHAFQTIASFSGQEKDKPFDFTEIQKILGLLNENVEAIDFSFDYEKLARVIKDNVKITVSGAGGVPAVNIKNASDALINPATEETLQAIETNTTVGALDTNNSSTTPLAGGGVFTGTATEVKDFVTVNVVVKASHASATNGLAMQFSTDGTNWDIEETHTIVGGTTFTHLSRAKARYFRIVYTNGATLQTYFRLATIIKNSAVSAEFMVLSTQIDDAHDAALVRAVLAAKKPNGDYVNIGSTAGGNLKVSIEETNGSSDIATQTTLALVNSKLIAYLYHGKKTSGSYDYYASKQDGGTRYKIMKKSSADPSDVTWAFGTDFTTDWANYTGLTYGEAPDS